MIVKKIIQANVTAAEVPALLDAAGVEFHTIENVNWPDVAPYKPEVRFRIAHNGGNILLQYVVREEHIRAEAQEDNGPVWEDSCVEFFMSLPSGNYYNIECNCAGTLLVGVGENRNERERAVEEIMKGVDRHSTIAERHFATTEAPAEWTISLVIPAATYYRDQISDFSGLEARGNFYKCGDMLPKPHFISMFPITVETPNFHLPAYFGDLSFEA